MHSLFRGCKGVGGGQESSSVGEGQVSTGVGEGQVSTGVGEGQVSAGVGPSINSPFRNDEERKQTRKKIPAEARIIYLLFWRKRDQTGRSSASQIPKQAPSLVFLGTCCPHEHLLPSKAAVVPLIKCYHSRYLFPPSRSLLVRTSLQSENRGLGSRLSWRWSGAPVLPSPENEIISSKAVVGGVDDFYMKGAALWRKGTVECPLPAEAPGDYMKLQNIFSLEKEWKGNVSNILLAETSCNMKPSYRAWCAVESMVQQNPQSLVWYVMTSKVVNLRQGVAGRLLEHYHNLRLVTVGLRQVFHNTPLMDLYTSTSWTHNTSELLPHYE
ncbi:putative lactosylceramide 4-alpha-galactosyltransferase-like 11 [Homarus americanus]|uniref:Putative lactosylceramide 4-alpha-galactosyltransferase-like 11 n=1 Tax=Homarus americanus TaxID=6706 RepID=A0A8J5MWU3_HOMAM|nr:putative lactosylceramide 4-alpha-galactosyltransferase-like 11 [Homarus americanus]